MSSRFHNKYHRHNHHTYPNDDPRFPDSSHDPIASPDSPFMGDFVLAGGLSASVPSASAYVAALFGNVGINTSLPNVELTVYGSISASTNTSTTELSVYDSQYIANNLGIGINNPPTALYVIGAGTFSDSLSTRNNTSTNELSVYDSQYIANNLGIGTNNPISPLHVVGNVTIMGNLSTFGSLTYLDTIVQITSAFSVTNVGTGPAVTITQTGDNAVLAIYDDSNIAMWVDGRDAYAGNVGIGVSATNAKLTVNGSISSNGLLTVNTISTTVSAVSPLLSAGQYIGGNTDEWNNVYTTTQTTSSNWVNAYTTTQTNSSNWVNAYTTTQTNSSNWVNAYTTTQANSANWNNDQTTMQSNSSNWNNTFNTVHNTSANPVVSSLSSTTFIAASTVRLGEIIKITTVVTAGSAFPVFDITGNLVGYVPIYVSFT